MHIIIIIVIIIIIIVIIIIIISLICLKSWIYYSKQKSLYISLLLRYHDK